MAELTIGIGMSHGPMVVSEASTRLQIGELDHDSTLLIDTAGTPVTFQELEQANGRRYAERATLERLESQRRQVLHSLARLKREIADAAPDVIVVIGDDQFELFDHDNMPALALYYGDELISCTRGRRGRYGARVGGLTDVHRGYGMDEHRRWPGHGPLASHLVASLIGRHFDVSAAKGITDPERGGIGHAFGIVEMQLLDEPTVPLVPVFVNTYWPPNQLPRRAATSSASPCERRSTAIRRTCASRSSPPAASAISSPTRSSTVRRSRRCVPAMHARSATCRRTCSTRVTLRSATGSWSPPPAGT